MTWGKFWTANIILGNLTLPFALREFVLLFIVPVGALLLGVIVLRIVFRKIINAYVADEARRDVFNKWYNRAARIIVIAGMVLSGSSLLGIKAWVAFGHFFRILNTPFFTSGKTQISFVSILLFVPIVIVAKWVGTIVSRSVGEGALKRLGMEAEKAFSLGRLIRYAVIVLVVIVGLSLVGIDLSAIGVLLGVLGIGIGFGLQFLVADFFAGVTLISMGLIKDGDRVRIADTYDGIIRHIRLMNTELLTFENETLIIPNSQLGRGVIHNFSYKDTRVMIINEVDVSYNSDLDNVIAIMQEVAAGNPWRDSSTESAVHVKRFADSGITMHLRTMILNAADGGRASSWTNLELWRAFRDNNIEIPFPQRVVHTASLPENVLENGNPAEEPLPEQVES